MTRLRLFIRALSSGQQPIPLAVAVFVLVTIGGLAAFKLHIPTSGVVTVWVPAGVVLGILLVVPTRQWPVVLASCVAGTITAEFLLGGNTLWMIAGGVANALESLCAAAIVRALVRGRVRLGSLRQLSHLVFGGMVASNALTSVGGVLVLGRGSLAHFGPQWIAWFIGDGLGMLVFAPLTVRALRWAEAPRVADHRPLLEALTIIMLLIPLAFVVLRLSAPGGAAPWLPVYVLFPFLVWTGVRHGVLAASAANAALAVSLLATLSLEPTLFAGATRAPLQQEIEIYLFILVGSISSLAPAALLEEREAIDRRLHASERRFLDLANSIEEAFFVIDVETRIVSYNNAAARSLLGTTERAHVDIEAWMANVHQDDRALLAAAIDTVKRGEVASVSLRVPGEGASWRWLHARAYPVAGADGAPQRVSCVASDITSLRRTEDQLRQSQKLEAVGQFASVIVHDFNNLLTVTRMAADTLEHDLPADSEALAEVAIIRGASERAALLSQQLLRFGRRQPAARRRVGLHALVRDIAPLLTRLVGSRVQFRLELAADLDEVQADPSDLEQVLFNLCKNAKDAMPDGGVLTVATSRPLAEDGVARAEVHLHLRDTGVGIDSDAIERIFNAGFTTKAAGDGAGLGLATVMRIVLEHGGAITVTSAKGEGTEFIVTLPLAPSDGVAALLT